MRIGFSLDKAHAANSWDKTHIVVLLPLSRLPGRSIDCLVIDRSISLSLPFQQCLVQLYIRNKVPQLETCAIDDHLYVPRALVPFIGHLGPEQTEWPERRAGSPS